MENKFKNILGFSSQEERILFEAEKMQLDFLAEVGKILEEKKWSKKDFAEKLGVSKSFISQIFSADKLMSMKLLAQIKQLLQIKVVIEIENTSEIVRTFAPKIKFSTKTNDIFLAYKKNGLGIEPKQGIETTSEPKVQVA
ncbi:MAG: helix-turn-helix domain-containing protein [Bacteroidia bacterium]